MKIVAVEGLCAQAEASGVRKSVRLDLLPSAVVGDYVLVHAGLAISKLDEAEAKRTLELLERLTQG